MLKHLLVATALSGFAASGASADTTRFATLNLQWFFDDNAPHLRWAEGGPEGSYEEHLENAALAIAEISPDVISLQEV